MATKTKTKTPKKTKKTKVNVPTPLSRIIRAYIDMNNKVSAFKKGNITTKNDDEFNTFHNCDDALRATLQEFEDLVYQWEDDREQLLEAEDLDEEEDDSDEDEYDYLGLP